MTRPAGLRPVLVTLLAHLALAVAASVSAGDADGPGSSSTSSTSSTSSNSGWLNALLATPQALLEPARADPHWHIPYSPADAGGPALPEEARLLAALRAHLEIAAAGGWPSVPESATLRAGVRDPAVAALRRRLRASDDYTGEMGADPWFFDGALDEALRGFQARHGLQPDGVFGAATRAAANISIAERITQLGVTLERWRWLPRDRGERYVWVNVGSSTLEIREGDRVVQSMRVIVGHPDRPTPALSGTLSQVVFNPTWTVPRIIAVEDLLPRQVEDPSFLARRGFEVLAGSGDREQAVDPSTVDWGKLGAGYFPYRLRQAPGPGNSLGRIKIGWDNPYDIYLHDTPARGLFGLGRRTLSSGCVRLEDAQALAAFLLQIDRGWSAEETARRVEDSATRVINLGRQVPVFIVYLTAWASADGRTHFRPDVYGRDATVLAALRRLPATPP
ncbi:MAG: L,D-transpeptidase family protein [Gammaproteobacteria bacterium]|nr:L,D-transpeptidase family protein [Gammaproteobacteria bacterium]